MSGKLAAACLAAVQVIGAAFAAGAGTPALASSCSCAKDREKMCIDATSAGPNAVCEKRKCPAGASFAATPCPTKDLVATCSLAGPDYVTRNRYYAPRWKPQTVKAMCAGMKGEFSGP